MLNGNDRRVRKGTHELYILFKNIFLTLKLFKVNKNKEKLNIKTEINKMENNTENRANQLSVFLLFVYILKQRK